MRNRTTEAVSNQKVPGGAPGVPNSQGLIVPASAPVSNPFAGRGPGPKPKRFRVLNGGQVMFHNVRTTLKAGKEVSSVSYDIAALQRQGIKLEPLVDDVEPEPIENLNPEASPATA